MMASNGYSIMLRTLYYAAVCLQFCVLLQRNVQATNVHLSTFI